MEVKVTNNTTEFSTLSREETGLAIAHIIAMRGTCQRAKVGCVITMDNRIISTGYNGGLGLLSLCHCNMNEKCVNAVHAEANAIAFAAKYGIALNGAKLYCTYSPCLECAKLIIQSGIQSVVYDFDYKTNPGNNLLISNGISITKYEK